MTISRFIGESLDVVGLRKPVLKAHRFISDSTYRGETLDVERDFRDLQRRIGHFMKKGGELADPGREVLIISQSNLPFYLKFHSLLGKALQVRGYKPVMVTYSHNRLAPRYFKLFGLNDVIYWDQFAKAHAPAVGKVEQVAREFLERRPGIQEIKQWKYRGVFVAKQALSRAIRRMMHGQFNLEEPSQSEVFVTHLHKAIESVHLAEHLLANRPIVKVLARDAGYTPNGCIYESALQQGIDSARVELGLLRGCWLLKRYTRETLGKLTLWSLSPETWTGVKDQSFPPEEEKRLEENFRERYDPSSKTDICKYQLGKNRKEKAEVMRSLGLDPKKKTAIVFSHITWDASFFDGDDLYDDYEHWLVETVRVACRNTQINWIIKLHPANVFKLKRENGAEEKQESELLALARLGPLPGHIRILRAGTEINTLSLFDVVDYGVTVRGTVGMELPWMRKAVITAGTGRYSGYGFVTDCATREEYERRLMTLHTVPPLSDEQAELARRYYYWMFLRRHVSFEDIAPMQSLMAENPKHPLHFNVDVTASSLQDLETSSSLKAFGDWFLSSEKPDFVV